MLLPLAGVLNSEECLLLEVAARSKRWRRRRRLKRLDALFMRTLSLTRSFNLHVNMALFGSACRVGHPSSPCSSSVVFFGTGGPSGRSANRPAQTDKKNRGVRAFRVNYASFFLALVFLFFEVLNCVCKNSDVFSENTSSKRRQSETVRRA
ncbi:hypothetical protein MRX96_057273 [Rhipicephalus microplus]